MFGRATGPSGRPQVKAAVGTKSTENVEVEETLSALDRARRLGTSKLSLQRLVYVNELVDCAHEIGYEATVIHLLPLVRKLASDQEVQVRQSLVGHFGDLAGFLIQSDPERGYQKVVDDLLPVVSMLLAEKVPEVRQGAADALITLASHLRPGERGDQVLMSVIALSHSNDDEDARGTAVQLFNGLAEALGQDLCRQFVGVELIALCEDPAFKVRKATASNFAEVARMAGDEYVLKRLLPAFERLVHDGHWGVRKAAAESLVGLAMALKPESRKDELVKLMNALLKDVSRWVRMCALQQLGYYIAGLENSDYVPRNLLQQYVEIIEQTKANPDAADISFHCGYTFAAVTKTMGRVNWPVLQAPFVSLCKDTQKNTRKAMAASMHIVAQTLGTDLTEQEVLPQFEALLQDPAHEVRLAAVRNIAGILRVVVPATVPQRRVTRALQGAMDKADNWRLRQLIASQLGAVCEVLVVAAYSESSAASNGGAAGSSDAAEEQRSQAKELTWSVLLPLFERLCSDSVAEVRDEAARSTARVLKATAPEIFSDPCDTSAAATGSEGSSGCSTSGAAPRDQVPTVTLQLVRKLIRTFALGKSFRARMTYVHMCDSVIRESPPCVLTDLLLDNLVRLAKDPVKNVRLLWAITMLPHIKRAGRLGQHPALICAAARMGKADGDKEVNRVFKGAQFAEVADTENEVSLNDLDLDLQSDASESLAAAEGGTGGCSDSGSAGVGEDDEQEDRGEDRERLQASQLSDASSPSSSSSANIASRVIAEPSVSSKGPGSPSALKSLGSDLSVATEQDMESSKTRGGHVTSPTAASPVEVAAHTTAVSPNSLKCNSISPKSPSSAPAFDPVEDSLVDQGEVEREMDDTFVERRFLAEAKADAKADVGTGAILLGEIDTSPIDAADSERSSAQAQGLGAVRAMSTGSPRHALSAPKVQEQPAEDCATPAVASVSVPELVEEQVQEPVSVSPEVAEAVSLPLADPAATSAEVRSASDVNVVAGSEINLESLSASATASDGETTHLGEEPSGLDSKDLAPTVAAVEAKATADASWEAAKIPDAESAPVVSEASSPTASSSPACGLQPKVDGVEGCLESDTSADALQRCPAAETSGAEVPSPGRSAEDVPATASAGQQPSEGAEVPDPSPAQAEEVRSDNE